MTIDFYSAYLPTLAFIPSLGPLEVGIIFLIVLILFGPGKMPEVFKAFGDGIRQFKKASKDVTDEITAESSAANQSEESKPS